MAKICIFIFKSSANNKKRRKVIKVIGVTGKVASGKSTVSKYIKRIKKDATILDIDKVAKKIYSKNPEVLRKLEQYFGKEIFDCRGNLIFKILAGKVFSSKRELEKLNEIMFPLIKNEVKNILSKNHKNKYIIIDAAVLFDCKLDELCDYIILVDNSMRRRKHFLKNNGFLNDEIELRIKGQYIKINKKRINFTINNDSSKNNLFEKVKKIIEIIENV